MLVLTAFVGMTANVSAQEQPVADAGGPYLNFECYPITLDASGSYDPDNDLLTYRWYIDGFWYDNGGSPQYEWTWLDDYSGEITLEVSDGLDTSLDTAEVMIVNVPPQNLTIDAPSEVDVDTEFFVFVSFFDGLPDPRGFIASLDSYTATFSWGDGSSDVFNLGVEEFIVSASHAYAEAGSYEITITIIDDDGGEAIGTWIILVDATMALVEAGPDGIIDEGSEFISAGYLADESGLYTALVDYGDGTEAQELLLNLGNTFDLQHQYGDNGVYSVIVTVFNEGEEWGSDSATVTVSNVPPSIESLTGPSMDPVQLGTPITVTGLFSDPGSLDTHIATIDWGDGVTTTIDVPFGAYLVTASHTYVGAGTYLITLTITDDDGGSDSQTLDWYIQVELPLYEGLSHGYWKNHNNWPGGYTKSMLVVNVFENASLYVPRSDTLIKVLKYPGGSGVIGAARILLRNAVASVLNARHSYINYPMLEADIIAEVNDALGSHDSAVMLDLEEILDQYNNLGADLTQ